MGNYNETHKTQIDEMVLAMPGVTSGKMFGYPGYKIKGKVFAFVGDEGIGIKLPEDRVNELVGSAPHFAPFEPAPGKVWKEWISIDRETSAAYEKDRALIEESIRFVAGD